LKAKNNLITTLRRENNDLKIQRAEATKQLNEINAQVMDMKRQRIDGAEGRGVLKENVNGDQQPQKPKQLTLSLKFDDIADKLLLTD
jgi:hypothetical protein